MTKEEIGWDDALTESYVGKYILVGITYLDAQGKLDYRQQLHGVIESASEQGIFIRLRGVYEGKTWNMPPMPAAIQPAEPGVYPLAMTGEEIENPDLLASWTVQAPPEGRAGCGDR